MGDGTARWLLGWNREIGDDSGLVCFSDSSEENTIKLDRLHVVSWIKTQLPVVQTPFAPALFVFFT